METRFEEVQARLGAGQSVTLEPRSPIYRGPYSSRIMDVSGEGVRVRAPMDDGKLVLLPVGTEVNVSVGVSDEVVRFRSVIVSRKGGRDRSLFLEGSSKEVTPDPEPGKDVQIIAVSSGKGGVGKTTFVVNLGIALAKLGRATCVIDGDLGTANVDVVLNLSPAYNLAHVVHGERHMLEVVVEGPEGLIVLPGGSGFQDLTTLSDEEFGRLIQQFGELEAYADTILIDTGSGLSPSVTNFLRATEEVILVTTPEPHAITDCYALIKVLSGHGYKGVLRLVINRAESEAEARHIGRKMTFASKRFLRMELEVLGSIVDDPAVPRSIRKQAPVVLEEPRSRASAQILKLAEEMCGGANPSDKKGGGARFLQRMRRLIPLGRAGV